MQIHYVFFIKRTIHFESVKRVLYYFNTVTTICVCTFLTVWRRLIGSLIFIGQCPQKWRIFDSSFVENDLQLRGSYESSPRCTLRAPLDPQTPTLKPNPQHLYKIHVFFHINSFHGKRSLDNHASLVRDEWVPTISQKIFTWVNGVPVTQQRIRKNWIIWRSKYFKSHLRREWHSSETSIQLCERRHNQPPNPNVLKPNLPKNLNPTPTFQMIFPGNKYAATLQLTATHYRFLLYPPRRDMVTATHCNTLQHYATLCNKLQHTTYYYNILQDETSSLQHTATHCKTLQHCNTLQHTATHCNTLQHANHFSSILQHEPCWALAPVFFFGLSILRLFIYVNIALILLFAVLRRKYKR